MCLLTKSYQMDALNPGLDVRQLYRWACGLESTCILTPPSNWCRRINKHQFANQELMLRSWECFSENVGNLQIRGDVRKADDIALVFISNKMAINLNVFGALMKYWIFSNTNCSSIMCIDRCCTSCMKTDIWKSPAKPKDFLISSRHSMILSFGRRFQDLILFFTFPRNQATTQIHTPSSCRTLSV